MCTELRSAGHLRKNKAFFFVSYQGTREANGATDQSLYKSVLSRPDSLMTAQQQL